jgi:transcriptional regulator with XRE-family HTH domain
MTAEKLATLLGVDKTTVSKWENNADPVGDQSERLLRTLVLAPVDQEATLDRELIITTLSAIGKERREATYISDPMGELHREYQPG